MTQDNQQHRRLNQPPALDKHTESQLEYLCKTNLPLAYHMIRHWERQGYNLQNLWQTYNTYQQKKTK